MHVTKYVFWLFALLLLDGSMAMKHDANLRSMIDLSKKKAQRAFLIIYVKHRGFLLMKAVKEKKGLHYQLPGGRIELSDFKNENITTDPRKLHLDQMVRVGKSAATRELWEETGMDMKHQYSRLEYLPGVTASVIKKRKDGSGLVAGTDFPRKLYYFVELELDEWHPDKIKLSSEQIGFEIEPDIRTAAIAARKHSGGDSGRALEAFEKEMETFLISK